ncbi:hypothetical protein ACHAWO_011123 [Cyclotella atomus]|uniref:DUF1524 domain-containing protein n=1 Tax=Cyclotella atomus TaxID=382360 RepID=A0ABD3MYI9_9STRA
MGNLAFLPATSPKYYYEKSVKMKSIKARHHLGALEQKAKNFERTFMHYSIAAKAEHKESLDELKVGFKDGRMPKDEFDEALRAHRCTIPK